MKKLLSLVLALALALGMVAVASADLPRKETVYFGGQQWDPIVGWNPLSPNMNNAMASSASPRGSRTIMFETLYMYNMLDGQLYPLLADGDYVWNDDMTECTVKIKSAAAWSDFTPGTANDMAATWEAAKALGNSTYTDNLSTSQAGDLHLNGNQALAYARIRYIGTDFERTKRQRVVMEDALDKLENLSLSEQSNILKEFLPRVHTDLTTSEILDLGSMVFRMKKYEVNSFSIPVDGSWSDMRVSGMDVLNIDFAKNRKAWEDAVS